MFRGRIRSALTIVGRPPQTSIAVARIPLVVIFVFIALSPHLLVVHCCAQGRIAIPSLGGISRRLQAPGDPEVLRGSSLTTRRR
jgi:hypothetical protein